MLLVRLNLPNGTPSRLTTDRQRGASAKDRRLQAKKVFKVFTDIKPDIEYILLDDIKTTGSTLDEAAKVLRNNAAQLRSRNLYIKTRNKIVSPLLILVKIC